MHRRLKAFPILENLDEDNLAELAPFFATETFQPGREIVRQNDPGDKFYIIARGKVEVWRTEEQSGNTKRVAMLQDGDFFGEITLITGFPRTATVRTATVCTCISLERGQFNRMMEGFPELRRKLSEVAVERLRESSKAAGTAAALRLRLIRSIYRAARVASGNEKPLVTDGLDESPQSRANFPRCFAQMLLAVVPAPRPEETFQSIALAARHDVDMQVRHALAHTVVDRDERAFGAERGFDGSLQTSARSETAVPPAARAGPPA